MACAICEEKTKDILCGQCEYDLATIEYVRQLMEAPAHIRANPTKSIAEWLVARCKISDGKPSDPHSRDGALFYRCLDVIADKPHAPIFDIANMIEEISAGLKH